MSQGLPSPCTNVCCMNADSGWCEGCHRTLDEIARWSSMDDGARREVLIQLAQRRPPSTHPTSATSTR